MPTKWQYFLGGLLAGIILTGIVILLISHPFKPVVHTIQITKSFSDTSGANPQTSSSNQGKININTATIDELINLPGIGPSKAAAIIEFREKYGLYEDINELLYVPGFGKSILSSIIEYIVVE